MSTLYQDIFDVQKINPEGKKFEKINRLLCKGLTNDVQLLIDINCDIGWRVHEGDKISVAFASSLEEDAPIFSAFIRAGSSSSPWPRSAVNVTTSQ